MTRSSLRVVFPLPVLPNLAPTPHLKKSAHAPLFLCVSPLFLAAPRLSFALAVVLDAARAARAAAAMITAVAAAVSAAAVVLLVSVITSVVVMLWWRVRSEW